MLGSVLMSTLAWSIPPLHSERICMTLHCIQCLRCLLQDSPHFKNEARKQAATEQKIVRMKQQAAQLSSAELATREKCALLQIYCRFCHSERFLDFAIVRRTLCVGRILYPKVLADGRHGAKARVGWFYAGPPRCCRPCAVSGCSILTLHGMRQGPGRTDSRDDGGP